MEQVRDVTHADTGAESAQIASCNENRLTSGPNKERLKAKERPGGICVTDRVSQWPLRPSGGRITVGRATDPGAGTGPSWAADGPSRCDVGRATSWRT